MVQLAAPANIILMRLFKNFQFIVAKKDFINHKFLQQ